MTESAETPIAESHDLVGGVAPPRRRRGRPAAAPAPTPIAEELRRRREMLRLSVREASRRTGISHTVISEIETGRRTPSLRTFERLRRSLGLDASAAILVQPAEPTELIEAHLVRLSACLWASGGRVSLSDLGAAVGLPAAAVREQLPLVADRLAACGVAVVDDGVEVRLAPIRTASPAVAALGGLVSERRRAALSAEAMEVVAYLGWHGHATRRQIEGFRGEDCETLLGRLVDAGFLATVRDDGEIGRPNHYRLTAVALAAVGVASPEELRTKMAPLVESTAVSAAAADGESPAAPSGVRPLPASVAKEDSNV